MKVKTNIARFLGVAFLLFVTMMFVLPEFAEARRGGRGSFGGSRSLKSKPSQVQQNRTNSFSRPAAKSRTSFGGARMTSQQAKAKYGTPRKVEQTVGKNSNGGSQVYNMHHYGGFSSGLMTGYMMGHTSMLWMMPFHPAFYYSRPQYVENADGTIDVYPPTLSFTKIIMGLILLGIVVWIIRRLVIRARGGGTKNQSASSFS